VPKIYIDKIEFYITNVCNLTCEYCNRFNNLNFKGWQKWDDYAEIYSKWSELLEFRQVVILGGEPLLNPTICDWAVGLRGMWDRGVQILSNGTRINHVDKLYETLKQIPNQKIIWLSVMIHNVDEIDHIVGEIEKFLKEPVKKIIGQENNKFQAPLVLLNDSIQIPVWITDSFDQNAIIKDADNRWTLHNSNPEVAHSMCSFADNKSYHFIKGKLYKCGPVALLPELDQQLNLAINDDDRQLLNSYQPLTLENFDSYHEEFFKKLDDPIPQCKFCPDYKGGGKIWPVRKGLVVN
jgi:organic radical activating enzyme